MSVAMDARPLMVVVAGPNGAGKTTFFHAHLQPAGLRFVNADVLAGDLGLDVYAAARAADVVRRELMRQKESFVFETVFSDPVGEKLEFMEEAVRRGYTVVLCFVGVSGPDISEERVAMRLSQGGHDVPSEKLRSRFPRTLENLKLALRRLPHVLVSDNDDLSHPFRRVLVMERGRVAFKATLLPPWLSTALG